MIKNFIPLDYDFKKINNEDYVLIYGKTNTNETCCIVDKFLDFFYILSKNPQQIFTKIKEIPNIDNCEIIEKNFLEKPVETIKIFFQNDKIKEIKEKIKGIEPESEIYEKDVNIITKYIIEKKIKPLFWYEVEGRILGKEDLCGLVDIMDVDFVLELDKVKEKNKDSEDYDFFPKVLAVDIETDEIDLNKGKILMVSLVSDNFKKVLTWKKAGKKDFVEYYGDEKEMLEKFIFYVKKVNPDIITTYFGDGFDLPYLRARAEKNKINLVLSKDNSRILFSRGKFMNSKIRGRVHIDIFKFIKTVYAQYMKSETLSLNEVAFELLGEKKHEFGNEKLNFDIEKFQKRDWERYFDYNLQDSVLTYKLFRKLWQYMKEFTKIVQEPLFNTTRAPMSHLVENYILHNLNRFNEICEKKPYADEIEKRKQRVKYEGAFVLQPNPGLYENLAFFDFTSMYSSVIVSFNLSKSTFLQKKEKNSYEIELENKKIYFLKKQGFMPKLLEEIIVLRKKYKKELKENPDDPVKKARSNSFKLLANAFYGYNGFFGARYYCVEAAAATAKLGRNFIKEAIEKTNQNKYNVIYADTDGFAFLLNKNTKKDTLKFLEQLNLKLPGIMELELEDFYKRGIWVTKRTGKFGAKKKYALIDYNDKIKIRGFETVRRDWCNLAREVQDKILEMILTQGNIKNAFPYIKEIIKKVKNHEIEKSKLLIRTQLKKPLSEYKLEGPHVAIARKMKNKGFSILPGTIISYYISSPKEGKSQKLVREKAKLPDEEGEYDRNYYIQNQLIPAVENIFGVFGINIKDESKEIINGVKQKRIGDF